MARTVIISTGAQSLMLGIEREIELVGHAKSRPAPPATAFFFREHDIAVVGGGDSASRKRSSSPSSPGP